MSDFNPQFNTPTPNYLRYSSSIQQPEADKSTGIALATLGTGMEEGAHLADTTIKEGIKDDIYAKVDTERDAFSSVLTSVKNGSSNPMDARAEDRPDIMAQDNTTPVPDAISNGLSKLGNIQGALSGNKISETTYYQRLNSIAKDMRSTYPGYRDYIDSEISKITGGNPANEYVRSIIQDINRQTTNANKEQDYWEKKITDSGYDMADQVLDKFKQDHDISKVQQWYISNTQARDKISLAKSGFELASKNREDRINKAEDLAYKAAEHAATSYFFNRQLTTDSQTSAQIADQMADVAVHPERRNDEVIRTIGTQLMMLKGRNEAETLQELRNTKTVDGKSVVSVVDVLGPKRVGEIVKENISNLYDTQLKLISDDQLGLAHGLQNAAGDSVNNTLYKILKDPSLNGRVVTAAALNKAAPNLSPQLTGDLIGGGITDDILKFAQEQKRQALAQTGGKYAGANGNIYTFKQAQEELGQAGSSSNRSVPIQAYKSLLDVRKAILEKDPKVVDNAITFFYEPTNRGTLNKFMEDYYDPNKRAIVQGRTGAFTDLTSPEITKAVWNRANNGNGPAWEYYSTWAKNEGAVSIRNAVGDLNTIEKEQTASGRYPAFYYHISWNTEKHNVGIVDKSNQPVSLNPSDPRFIGIRNMNKTLDSLSNIAKTEGSNVDAYLLKVMKDAGWSPTKEVGGVPSNIMRALITGSAKPKPEVPISK